MKKILKVKVIGTKTEIFRAEMYLKILEDFQKLGLTFEKALKQTAELSVFEFKSKKS